MKLVSKSIRYKAAIVALIAACSAIVVPLGSSTAGAASALKPKSGGTATLTAAWTSLDPDSPTFSSGTQDIGFEIYDALFTAFVSGNPKGSPPIQPDLALSYAYTKDFKTLTIDLRHGVKFQDGTAFNAAAVQFNILREAMGTNTSAEDMTALSSVSIKGNYTVIVHLKAPDSNFIWALAVDPAMMMVSPTAVNTEGATQFGLAPVGAGPFKVTANNPDVSLTVSAWNGYWNQKHRYLDAINFIEAPSTQGDVIEYDDVQSGSLTTFYDTAIGSPSVLSGAKTNPGVSYVTTPSLAVEFLQVDTLRPPLNNLSAREALDYCMDRSAITTNLYGGFPTPAYVMDPHNTLYQPSFGSKPPPGAYNFNPTLGKQIVASLGGLTIQFEMGASPVNLANAEAIGEQWTGNCGITVDYDPTSAAQITQNSVTNNFEVTESAEGGLLNPEPRVAEYDNPASSSDKGVFSPTITNLLNATGYTDNPTALSGIWTRILDGIAKNAAPIPLFAAKNYFISAKNAHGIEEQSNQAYLGNAWFS